MTDLRDILRQDVPCLLVAEDNSRIEGVENAEESGKL